MRYCKLVHQSQSQNCVIFISHIWSILWKNNILFFFLNTYDYQFLQNILFKKNCLCPEEGLHFCYFNLTLGHLYTFNTWHSQKKAFPQSFIYGKYFSFATLVTPISWGLSNFNFPATFFLPNISWRISEHEQKPKLVFVEAE